MGDYQKEYVVTAASSAESLGSGELPVLGTPAVVAFSENCCQELARKLLVSGETTVGVQIQLEHLKASKIGGSVTVTARLTEQTTKLLSFEFTVSENQRCLARGTHQRAIVDVERFMSKIE